MENKLRLSITADPSETPIDKIRVLLSEKTEAGAIYVPMDLTDPRMNFQLALAQDPSEMPILMDVSYGKTSFPTPSVGLHMIGYADGVPVATHTGRLNLEATGIVEIHLVLIPEHCDPDQDGFLNCDAGCCTSGTFLSDCQMTVASIFPWHNPETCDTFDNDCDGETDEEIEALGDVCFGQADDPQCRPEGVYVCKSYGTNPICKTQSTDGDTCEDDDACTQNEQCKFGDCSVSMPVNCDDGDECTVDSCDPKTGCVHKHDPACDCTSDEACSDGNACNGAEVCADDGDCKQGPIPNCDDGNPCTKDSCDPNVGCVHEWNPDACECETDDDCNDDNICNGVETCSDAFMCESTGPLVCDDGNVCTDDDCNLVDGCVYTPNTLGCDDGNACTSTDVCSDGNCIGTKPIDCTALDQCHDVGICNPDTGTCSNPALPNGSVCDDGDACTDTDTCQSGSCESGSQIVCTDDNVCTDDTCNPATGCVFTPNTLGCDDGDACSDQDTCQSGSCQPGDMIVCDDDDVCNGMEACNAATGCVSGVPLDCDDNDPCTTDSCDEALGCTNEPILGCSDGPILIPLGSYMDSSSSNKSVSAFLIDQTEVTVAKYQECVEAGDCNAPAVNPAEPEQCNGTDKPNHPVNCVTPAQAVDYCTYAAKGLGYSKGRLPTVDEWKKAMRGGCVLYGNAGCDYSDDYRLYPWGDSAPTCTKAVYTDQSGIGCGTDSTFPVGSKPGGDSPYDIWDGAGNVAEMVSGTCSQVTDTMICGGSFTSATAALLINGCYCVSSFGSGYGNPTIGLRCTYEP